MTQTIDLINLIKMPFSKVERKFYVKRRQISDGQFESTWQDLTRNVKSWGSYGSSLDVDRFGVLRFDNASIRVDNVEGKFNPNDNEFSFWNGYGDLQRSLVKIECGFIHQTLAASGIWQTTTLPTNTTIFIGILSGDVYVSSRNEVVLPLKPISQVFRDFPAKDLTGFTSTGISSGGWIQILRDQTDGSGSYIFRPFIGDGTSTDWSISSGSNLYSNLNTSTAQDLYQLDCWDVTERLAQSENKIGYLNRNGQFIWSDKTTTASTQFEFYGLNYYNRTYGHTIKNIARYGKRLTSFYSRVAVKYDQADTSTSFVNTSLAFAVSGSNTAWNLGHRTFNIENFWIPNSAAAASVASAIFADISSQKEEIEFSTTLITHLDLLDKITVSYDASDFSSSESLWDINNWAPDPNNDDLIWDRGRGDAITLNGVEFKLLSIKMDLDNLETKFIAKQL